MNEIPIPIARTDPKVILVPPTVNNVALNPTSAVAPNVPATNLIMIIFLIYYLFPIYYVNHQ